MCEDDGAGAGISAVARGRDVENLSRAEGESRIDQRPPAFAVGFSRPTSMFPVCKENIHERDAQARQIPLGRPATPADIAAAILYLSTPMAAHVTGNVIAVDGGASLGPGQAIAKSQRGD